jgi:hypothetical protein
MPARDYGDLSRLALKAELDIDELRASLARINDAICSKFGCAAAYICTSYAYLAV